MLKLNYYLEASGIIHQVLDGSVKDLIMIESDDYDYLGFKQIDLE